MWTITAALTLLMTTSALDMNIEDWGTVHDRVMGGVSSGRITEHEGFLSFRGELSLANNGGFASVRRLAGAQDPNTEAIRVSVRGDGRRYQLRIRQDRNFDGVAWVAEFDTTDTWQDITVSLSDFRPQFRGRPVAGAGDIEPELIRQVGFLLADKNEGPFRLDFRSIEFLARP